MEKHFSFVMLFIFIMGCGVPTPEHQRKRHDDLSDLDRADPLDLATLKTEYFMNYSILAEYRKAAQQQSRSIRYPFCVYGTGVSKFDRQRYWEMMNQTVNRWNRTLISMPGWEVDQISLELVGDAGDYCPIFHNDMKVYKMLINPLLSRSYANFWQYEFVAGSDFLNDPVRMMLHEYGHQLGLGDTYVNEGYQNPSNQPISIMNGFNNWAESLTPDDLDSVRHIWSRLLGSTSTRCPGGYVDQIPDTNRLESIFCVKQTSAGSSPSNQAPVAVIKFNKSAGVAPLSIRFSGGRSYDPDGRIASYRWDFDDGTKSLKKNPTKNFLIPRTYKVTLTVMDKKGAVSSTAVLVDVTN